MCVQCNPLDHLYMFSRVYILQKQYCYSSEDLSFAQLFDICLNLRVSFEILKCSFNCPNELQFLCGGRTDLMSCHSIKECNLKLLLRLHRGILVLTFFFFSVFQKLQSQRRVEAITYEEPCCCTKSIAKILAIVQKCIFTHMSFSSTQRKYLYGSFKIIFFRGMQSWKYIFLCLLATRDERSCLIISYVYYLVQHCYSSKMCKACIICL